MDSKHLNPWNKILEVKCFLGVSKAGWNCFILSLENPRQHGSVSGSILYISGNKDRTDHAGSRSISELERNDYISSDINLISDDLPLSGTAMNFSGGRKKSGLAVTPDPAAVGLSDHFFLAVSDPKYRCPEKTAAGLTASRRHTRT